MAKYLLYQIVHIESGTTYVGQTHRAISERWAEHRRDLRKGRHGNRYLQFAWDKHGEEAFEFEIINEFKSLSKLDRGEIELIKNTPNVYNLDPGGKGHKHSKKAKKVIGEANKIPIIGMNIKTREIREYASAADAGRSGFDDAAVRKCVLDYPTPTSLASKIKKITLSTNGWVWMAQSDYSIERLIVKCQQASVGKIRLERAVLGMNVFTKEILRFKSASEAGRNKFFASTVHKACNRNMIHKGFVWAYADSPNPQSLLDSRASWALSKSHPGTKSWQF